MKFIDYVVLGLRNIWRRKSRSFLTIFAVVIGAISVVIMLSLVIGAQNIATQQLESINGLTLISVSASSELESNGGLLDAYINDQAAKKLNDSDVVIVKNVPHVVDATPMISIWIDSGKLEGQDKRYRTNVLAYVPGTQVLNIPVVAGRSLEKGDMDKIVIGMELVRSFGYSSNPEVLIGKKIILYTKQYSDWGETPPKPPQNDDKSMGSDKSYMEDLQKQLHPITVEIVGVAKTGADESQNYITLDFGRRLMTILNWENNETLMNQYYEKRKYVEDQINRELESQKQLLFANKEQMNDEQIRASEEKLNFDREKLVQERMTALGYNYTNSDFLVLKRFDEIAKSGYGSILVRIDNTENIEQVGKDIKSQGYGVVTAKAMLDQIKKIFGLVGLIIGAIGGIVLFVAALGIINNMVMATYERTREIGILRACGATRANIRRMFIFEAGTLGFLGGMIGLIVSFGLAKIMNVVGNSIALSQGVPINNIISFPLWLIVGVIALTTIIGILAGLFPAIHAARMDPVEALRYE